MLIACVVGCCQVHSISSVDQQKQQITVSYYEYQQWVDPRLSFDTEAEALCVLGAGTDDYTWIPLDEVNNHNKNLVVTGDRSPGTLHHHHHHHHHHLYPARDIGAPSSIPCEWAPRCSQGLRARIHHKY